MAWRARVQGVAAPSLLLWLVVCLSSTVPVESADLYPFVEFNATEQTMPQVLMQTGLYGYVLFNAANLIGEGAELLLLVPSMANLVGSIVVPILGAVPDGMMVLCSGLGPPAVAQEQVKVGIGALAGSTIMLLTLPWFLAVVAGRVSVKDGNPTYTKPRDAPENWEKLLPPVFHPLHTGVGIGTTIKKNAKLMIFTASTYLVIQGSCFYAESATKGEPADQANLDQAGMENSFAWAGLVLCCVWFVYYMVKMLRDGGDDDGMVQEKIVKTTVAGIETGKLTLRGALAQFGSTWDSVVKGGGLSESLLDKTDAAEEVRRMCKLLVPFFRNYDNNGDNQISLSEFRMIMKDLRENISWDKQQKLFEAADVDNSGFINFEEFVACLMAFALDPAQKVELKNANGEKRGSGSSTFVEKSDANNHAGDDDEEEEEDMPEDLADLPPEVQQKKIKVRAFTKMTIGTVLVLLFSDPMCDMLGIIGLKIGVKPFFVSFVLAPLASNASELVSAMKLAQKRTMKSMVNSLCSLEGAAIMNNTFCLGIFLVLIVWKGLVWQFSAETISIVAIEIMVAVMVLLKKVHTLLDAVIVLSFYPLSLVIVKVLEDNLGLD